MRLSGKLFRRLIHGRGGNVEIAQISTAKGAATHVRGGHVDDTIERSVRRVAMDSPSSPERHP